MDPVVHFEIPADNVERAKKFYASLFGWQLNDVPGMDYTLANTTPVGADQRPTTPGAINGGMMKRQSAQQRTNVVIKVKSIDATLPRIVQEGGKIAMEKTPVADMGFTAYFQDPEGNVLGLWQDATARQ
ncbi:MAG TPA: VOC family protein [Candidatus Thermoplasmatota archaeon]|nr:VOC family protein [Candidatus Thermoplasmatota archaeon]